MQKISQSRMRRKKRSPIRNKRLRLMMLNQKNRSKRKFSPKKKC